MGIYIEYDAWLLFKTINCKKNPINCKITINDGMCV